MMAVSDLDEAYSLNGLTLASAFMQQVLQHPDVTAISERLLQIKPHYASIFSEGHAPGPTVNFNWKLDPSVQELAYDFGRQIIFFLDEPSPQPDALEVAVANAIVERIAHLVDYLARGKLVAVGTFTTTGIESNLGIGQWKRKDLVLDVENSAVCENRTYPPGALWTGVWLQVPSSLGTETPPISGTVDPDRSSRPQIRTINKSRNECVEWMTSLISDPTVLPVGNDKIVEMAKAKWPGKISQRQLRDCRNEALARVNDDRRMLWTRPGPKVTSD